MDSYPAALAPDGIIHALRPWAGRGTVTACGRHQLTRRWLGHGYVQSGWLRLPSAFEALHERRHGSLICRTCLEHLGLD